MAKVASPKILKYFDALNKEVAKSYDVAKTARLKGLDPETEVEIFLANSMAERVIGIISIVAPQLAKSNIISRIEELEAEYGLLDWRVGFKIAEEVAKQKFCEFKNKIEAMEVGIRTGFSYLTLGIVSAPLEGFIGLKIKKRKDGKEYFSLQYAGPVRGAGGTASSVSVILSDYVRVKMGYAPWDATEKEINRNSIEVSDYHERVTNLQYRPSNEELKFMLSNLPIEVSGDPTEKIEVSNYKDLPRLSTNLIRGGMCLVLAEGLCQKAPKLWKRLAKWGKDFDLEWGFMEDFLKLKEEIHSKHAAEKKKKPKPTNSSSNSSDSNLATKNTKKPKKSKRLSPKANDTFVTDIVAGRPVITHPISKGGLRLRYGRTRVSGFSAAAIHPASLIVLDKYFAIGTQCKVERPGKAATLTLCDTIEGPIVKLKDGTVLKLKTEDAAKQVNKEVDEVLFLGDILFNFGDFSENGHKLVPAGYCPEWWILEVKKAINAKEDKEKEADLNFPTANNLLDLSSDLQKQNFKLAITDPLFSTPSFELAKQISEKLNVPLHPEFTDYWRHILAEDLKTIISFLTTGKLDLNEEGKIIKAIFPFSKQATSENLQEQTQEKTLEKKTENLKEQTTEQQKEQPKENLAEATKQLFEIVGMEHEIIANETLILKAEQIKTLLSLFNVKNLTELKNYSLIDGEYEDALDYFEQNSPLKIRDKSGTFIGARMGRPEKAKMRAMQGRPHMLFPVGEEGGRMRSIQGALEKSKGKIVSQFNKDWILELQAKYGEDIVKILNNRAENYATVELDIKKMFKNVLKELGLRIYPDLIKGTKKISNKNKLPENIIKGIYRAKNGIAVNKDGTTRYDCTELPITHFKPKEIGTSIEKLKKLGYDKDIFGKDLQETNQTLEIFPQDVILPQYDSIEEGSATILMRVSNFIDEILVNFYDLKPFYNVKSKEDLIGHLIIGLAPHISAGTVGRIIGFSQTQGMLAHPMFHAGLRRDCDGDEAAALLLMDGLLNFSKKFLPSTRGATMDCPLVLTPNLSPAEVDDQVLGVDVQWSYPLELYESALQMKAPWEIRWGKEEKKIEQLDARLGKENQYEDFGFTHKVADFNKGVKCSAYKTVPSMREKLFGQMEIARKVSAVNMDQVARLVIQRHFLADIKGNFRKFSMQSFRCSSCNTKYRRPPITSRCTECVNGKIIFTISEGSVVKYLQMSLDLCDKYDFSPYLKQTIHVLKENIDVVFGKEQDRQVGLAGFIK